MDEKRIVELALAALQARRAAVEAEIAQLTGGIQSMIVPPPPGVRRPRTAAQRKAQSKRMKASWAARKAKAAKLKAPKPRQTAAANKARAEKMKAYWAKRRAEKRKR